LGSALGILPRGRCGVLMSDNCRVQLEPPGLGPQACFCLTLKLALML
jgi:hypothetical protein